MALAAVLVLSVLSCAGHKPSPFVFPVEQMRMPPAGLTPAQVPLFVSFGSDDNPYSGLDGSGGGGGLHYLTELFASRRGADGNPLHYSFYVNTTYIQPNPASAYHPGDVEDPASVMRSWKEAIDHGNEIGVHTHSHPHGRDFTAAQWEHEIRLCIDHLTESGGLAVPRDQLLGFRTPFLEYGAHTLEPVSRMGFAYDCSIEEGQEKSEDGRNFLWPYKMDHGSPGNRAAYERSELPYAGEYPGLWEIPVYVFLVPPDDLCESYGVPRGFRARMKAKNDYFDVEQGKITGMDWNLWFEFGMSKAEFLATLKYTLDLRLQGNRCPLTVGVHSAIYADRSPENPPNSTVQERRDALREFLDYAISKQEVRVVSAKELLAWLKNPVPLAPSTATAVAARVPGAGFRYSVYGQKTNPGVEYWVRVGREMAARFPGSTPEVIWIVGRYRDRGIELPFAVPDAGDPLITGSSGEDFNEAALSRFDELGFRVWLQVEPRFASVEKLIHLVLQRYGHHRSVIGFGIDVEWYRSLDPDGGDPVTDADAASWLAAARSHNPAYRFFLKHWLPEKMPPTVRDGFLFVDDSQVLPSMDAMVDEFAVWGKTFAPAPVAFQIGYPSDRPWWHLLKDPPKELGDRILQVTPNTEAIIWVNFSVLEVFPPDRAE